MVHAHCAHGLGHSSNVNVKLSSWIKCLILCLSLPLHLIYLYASKEGTGEIGQMGRLA